MFNIRVANIQDADAIIGILNQAIQAEQNAYITPYNISDGNEWVTHMLEHAKKAIVVENDGNVVGWGSLMPYRNGRGAFESVVEIVFYVHNAHQGKGMGNQIVGNLEQQAKGLKLSHLVAILLDDNEASKKLLAKNGFNTWGLFEDIAQFPDRKCGHLYMGKPIL